MDKDAILERLAKGAVLKRQADGSCRLGRRAVAADVLAAMVADDLLQPLADGRFDLSALGAVRARRVRLCKANRGSKTGTENSDGGDDTFRAQHQLREIRLRSAREGHGRVSVNVTESPLGWLRKRRDKKGRSYLGERHVEAGERLRSDFELAALPPRVTAQWSAQPISRGKRTHREAPLSDRQIAARQRFHKAADALPVELKDMVVRVCCFHEGLEGIERQEGWPVRSGKLVLRVALEQLADHYGLAKE